MASAKGQDYAEEQKDAVLEAKESLTDRWPCLSFGCLAQESFQREGTLLFYLIFEI